MIPFFTALSDRFHELHSEVLRDLEVLPDLALDWKPGSEMNSIAVIIMHLTGAERFLIGDVIMGEPSNRNRDDEFKAAGLARKQLVDRLNQTEIYLNTAFERLSLDDLQAQRLHPRHGDQVSVSWALLHALEHAATHVGHIQLTVQLWQQRTVGES
ncbi:MAG: hypothetical protein C3F13_18150 [Anaerolineales bacterium]|nr:DUF1572 domain-containing protein [Anaerolineae bacterium]PWB49761.1 MAG: hypothetical protein C3F13_18150 [Anaerolineales bacterium]